MRNTVPPIGRPLEEVARDRDLLRVATDRSADDDRKMADEELSLQLLAGRHFGANGQPITRYLKPNSPEERLARAALARIVREYMGGFSGELLALAIDPITPSKWPGTKPTRHVRFESPARGKPSAWARDLLVVGHIRRELFRSTTGKEDAALKSAEDAFGLTPAATAKIWRAHKKAVGRN
jgi:hypothetical protein